MLWFLQSKMRLLVKGRTRTLYLQMVVHPRAHKLPEGVVHPLPHPAVNGHALRPEADGLGLEIPLLGEHRQKGRALAVAATFLSRGIPPRSPEAHLHGLENVPEHRALLPLVRLGSVLVAVRGQGVQFVTQVVPVVKLEVLEKHTHTHRMATMTMCSRPTQKTQKARIPAYAVQVSGQLEQQGDGLAGSDSHVDVVALQQLRQFGQVSEKVDAVSFPNPARRAGGPQSWRASLAQDVLELAGGADGEQQRPGQQSVGVELAGLRADGGTRPVRSGVGAGEQRLEALHRSLHVLKRGDGDSTRHGEATFPP